MKRLLYVGLVLTLHFSILNPPANSSLKEGSKCTSLGKFSGKLTCVSLDGKKFWYEVSLGKGLKKYAQVNTVCYRENLITIGYDSNRKLTKLICKYSTSIQGTELPQWTSQNDSTSEKTKNSEPKTLLSDPSQFAVVDKCRIKHLNPHGTSMVAGFPIVDRRVDLVKGLKAQIIGVDFPDKVSSTPNVKVSKNQLIAETERFWREQSTVPLKFEWNWKEDWIRMPNPIKSYDLGGSFFEGKFRDEPYWSFVRNVISIADKSVDFTGVNFLFIVFPEGIKVDEIGSFLVHTQGTYTTSEGSIYNLILAGGTYGDVQTYIHEFGHGLGLTDIRDVVTLSDQRSGQMYFDTMNNSVLPELFVWHRFLLGFLENQQIHCITTQVESTHLIAPVALSTKKLKGLVIPLTETTGIIVEVRRPLGWDSLLANPAKMVYEVSTRDLIGTVVYILDTNVEYMRTPVKVIKVLRKGESISSNGYKISVIESGDFGDVVKVEKVV